jgi:ankyrin repeat protein
MKNDAMWQLYDKNMRSAIQLCSSTPGASPEFAIELLAEAGDGFRELLPNKPRILQQTLGEFVSVAVIESRPDAIKALAKLDANMNWRATDSLTALHVAAKARKADLIHVLVENGADLELQTGAGGRTDGTALHIAVDLLSVPTLSALVKAGANINAQDDSSGRSTPLHIAAGRADRYDEAKPEHIADAAKAVTALLELGANPMIGDGRGVLPLHEAVSCGNTVAAMALLKAGTYSEEALFEALRLSCVREDSDLMLALIDAGADPCGTVRLREGLTEKLDKHLHGLGAASTIVEQVRSLMAAASIVRAVSSPVESQTALARTATTSGPI